MKNKIALVTGGTGGIGSAIVRHLHDLGAKVVATYNKDGNHQLARDWQEQRKQEGYTIDIFYANVADFDSAAKLAANMEDKYGRVDVLINNAGVTADVTLKKMSPEQWLKVINTNLNGVFNVTRSILNLMLKKPYGRIINISSINGQKGQFGQANYSAAKAGIHGFTKALAQEVASKNITVNTISPGYVRTSMLECVPEDVLNEIIKNIPVGRLAEPMEVAKLVGFLAASDAAFITGANFAINGGQHMY